MRLDPQPWMTGHATRKLMAALREARFVGGAVRNTLLARKVEDIDVATPLLPGEVEHRLKTAGIQAVHTGIEHGTITAVVEGKPFEVTTLRHDVETDGRRAVVAFTTDWAEDAQRRDFTMNALYASADGEVFDTVGGVMDLKAGRVHFVGDPVRRIREDYLRILRLFRFHAWYGRGGIELEALQAVEQEKSGIAILSGERIAKEMLRLLEAANPVPVLRAMTAYSILPEILPGEADVELLENLVTIDTANGFAPDALLRLAMLMPREAASVADRWKMSNAQRERLENIAADGKIAPALSQREAQRLLYRFGPRRFKDRLFLAWAGEPKTDRWGALLKLADDWQRPRFPLTGADAMRAGVPEGPLVGRVLAEVEEWWIDNGFAADASLLAERLKQAVRAAR
jgi:poly(A) polymerase